jgi:hypothetical protein
VPLAVEGLTKQSGMGVIREAISDSISTLIKEGKTPKEAAGQAFGMARDRTGKELKKHKT